ncbi:MAG: 4-coumarate--CoA ligase family protein, partial [Acidobacteriota bacterium]|nr:4-coumarate--CoA ligase family protein [Acidobacteriota bacterium]
MIFRSPYPEVNIPEVPLTRLVLRRVEDLADKPALVHALTGRVMTYGELGLMVRRAAAGLRERGFKKGDVLAIYSPNLLEYAVLFHAVVSLGGIVTTVNPLYNEDELAAQLNDASAKYLFTIPQLMSAAREAQSRSNVREIFVFGEAEGATAFDSLLESEGAVPAVEINVREDLAALPYSSGTTGVSKGVMLSHYNMAANLCQMELTDHIAEEDTLIAALPFFHIYGLHVIMNMGLYAGATLVVMTRFDLESFLHSIQRYRVTRAHVVPPIMLALAKQPVVDRYDLSSLKLVMSAAAPLREETSRACTERLKCFVKQGYGMTEASPATHMCPEGVDEIRHGSVGQCVPNTECKVVDLETGGELGPNQEGEICVRGPQVMLGYLNRPEATLQAIDADGWLHTGDVGYADEAGFFYIVDRAKELIKYKAFQVAPAELEAVLLTHPSVADAAVIPSPDEEAGEVPKAFVVLKRDATEEEIKEFVRERVAPFKKIRRVEFIEQIPKSASGKILRCILIQRERERKQEE